MASAGLDGEARRARLTNERREPADLLARHFLAARRDAVVAPPGIVLVGMGPVVELLDEAVMEHPLDGAVQRPGAEPQRAAGARGDVLHDGVAVALAVGERDEDMKDGEGQRHVAQLYHVPIYRQLSQCPRVAEPRRHEATRRIRRKKSTVSVDGTAMTNLHSAGLYGCPAVFLSLEAWASKASPAFQGSLRTRISSS